MSILIGRKRECERLEKCMKAATAQLVVVYGRRRVGKTFLVNQYFKNKLEFTYKSLTFCGLIQAYLLKIKFHFNF